MSFIRNRSCQEPLSPLKPFVDKFFHVLFFLGVGGQCRIQANSPSCLQLLYHSQTDS
uniref:Uncharacterized protein n=1 Tax=Anguilla anguilla TaxID=7936 RepID=A0A0E9RCT8_ANGAN